MSPPDATNTKINASSPDDLRRAGWSVAVHNDYRLGGKLFTFWLFTRGGFAIKGEGRTDAEALNIVRSAAFPIDCADTMSDDPGLVACPTCNAGPGMLCRFAMPGADGASHYHYRDYHQARVLRAVQGDRK